MERIRSLYSLSFIKNPFYRGLDSGRKKYESCWWFTPIILCARNLDTLRILVQLNLEMRDGRKGNESRREELIQEGGGRKKWRMMEVNDHSCRDLNDWNIYLSQFFLPFVVFFLDVWTTSLIVIPFCAIGIKLQRGLCFVSVTLCPGKFCYEKKPVTLQYRCQKLNFILIWYLEDCYVRAGTLNERLLSIKLCFLHKGLWRCSTSL